MTVMLNKFKFITSCLIKLTLTTSEHFRPSPALPVSEFLFRSIPTLWTGNGTPTMLSFLLPAHRGSSGQRAVKRVCLYWRCGSIATGVGRLAATVLSRNVGSSVMLTTLNTSGGFNERPIVQWPTRSQHNRSRIKSTTHTAHTRLTALFPGLPG